MKKVKNIEIQRLLNQERRFDDDLTTREIRNNNTRNKNQEHVSEHQERKSEDDEKDRRNHAFEIINKKCEMTRKK